MNVRAALGPQPLHVEILFSRTGKESGIAIAACVRSDKSDRGVFFE